MKRLLHISDLHFGRINPSAVEALQSFLLEISPAVDLIVVTGDWTQRARTSQYKAAADFVKSLPCPVLSIPGNHDIPLYNVWKRLSQPLHNYNQFIRAITTDTFTNSEVSIVGIQTPTRLRTIEGRIALKDFKNVQKVFKDSDLKAIRILACHHPMRIPLMKTKIWPFFWVKKILNLKPHLVLSGHSHKNWIECEENDDDHQIWHISAGSATSDRLRGEANSFHIIDLKAPEILVQTYFLGENGFIIADTSPELKITLKI